MQGTSGGLSKSRGLEQMPVELYSAGRWAQGSVQDNGPLGHLSWSLFLIVWAETFATVACGRSSTAHKYHSACAALQQVAGIWYLEWIPTSLNPPTLFLEIVSKDIKSVSGSKFWSCHPGGVQPQSFAPVQGASKVSGVNQVFILSLNVLQQQLLDHPGPLS